MAPLFLGLDLSTQQLKAVVVQEDCSIVHESAVHFDRDLPHFGTTNGAIQGPNGQVTSPVAMWVEAIDLILDRMKDSGVDLSSVAAVSGAGQVKPLHAFIKRNAHFSTATWLGILVRQGRSYPSFT
jgi:xylulokinase